MMRYALICWTMGLLAVACWGGEGESILTDDRANGDWSVSGNEATWTGSGSKRGPTMVIDSASFASGPLMLLIEGGGNEFVVTSGSRKIVIPLGEGASHSLTLTGGKNASVQADGQAVDSAQRMWERICGKASIELTFPGVTGATTAGGVKVSWQRGAGGVASTDPLVANLPGAGVVGGEQLALDRAKQAMLRLRIDTSVPGLSVFGQAIVIDANGMMITRAHLLREATAVWALLPLGDAVAVRVLSVDAVGAGGALDVAILRLDPTSDRWQKSVQPLDVAQDVPSAGAEVFAMGANPSGRFVLGKAKVQQTQLTESLSPALGKQLGVGGSGGGGRWIVTDLPVSIDASGGALVDGLGRLMGLNVWVWPGQMQGGLATSASQVDALRQSVDAFSSMSMEQVRKAAGAAIGRSTFPVLITSGQFDPQRLQRATNHANDTTICVQCKGEGHLTVQRQVGYTPGTMRKPIYESRDLPCSRCEGTGLNHAGVVFDVLAEVAGSLAFVKREDEDFKRIEQWTEQTLGEIGKRHTVELAKALNDQADGRMAEAGGAGKLAVGQPVVVLGWMDKLKLEGEAEDPMVVKLTDGAKEQTIILRDVDLTPGSPGSSGRATRTKTALVGGLLAGYVTDASNQRVPVLQKCFVISVPSEGLTEPAKDRNDRTRPSRYQTR